MLSAFSAQCDLESHMTFIASLKIQENFFRGQKDTRPLLTPAEKKVIAHGQRRRAGK